MTVAHIYYDGEIMSNDPGAKGCYDIKEVCFLFLFNFSIFIKKYNLFSQRVLPFIVLLLCAIAPRFKKTKALMSNFKYSFGFYKKKHKK